MRRKLHNPDSKAFEPLAVSGGDPQPIPADTHIPEHDQAADIVNADLRDPNSGTFAQLRDGGYNTSRSEAGQRFSPGSFRVGPGAGDLRIPVLR